MKLEDFSLPVQVRLRSVEVLLINYGYVNRGVLCDLHGLAVAAVSKDIANYNKLNSDGCFYNRKTKKIEKLITFKPIFK